MSDWPTPDYDRELDGKDETIPCPYCGAAASEPCSDTCDTLAPLDVPGDVDWSNVAAAWAHSPWAGELKDDDADWCPVCNTVTEYDGETCKRCGRVWGTETP